MRGAGRRPEKSLWFLVVRRNQLQKLRYRGHWRRADFSNCGSQTTNLAAVVADMAVEQARMHADIFSILTVEQQEKAKQLEAQGRRAHRSSVSRRSGRRRRRS